MMKEQGMAIVTSGFLHRALSPISARRLCHADEA